MLNELLLPIGFLTNIRGAQLIVILLAIFLLFGSKRLPGVARSLGNSIREFRKSLAGVQEEFRNGLEEDANAQPKKDVVVAAAPAAQTETNVKIEKSSS